MVVRLHRGGKYTRKKKRKKIDIYHQLGIAEVSMKLNKINSSIKSGGTVTVTQAVTSE